MKDKIALGLVGLGVRGYGVLESELMHMKDITIIGVCDIYEDRMQKAANLIEEKTGSRPFTSTDYRAILKLPIDAIIITASWEAHIPVALAAMEAGIYVGTEVAGAYSLDSCWQLVRTYERTGTPCMMLENCCYGKRELMLLNMIKQGVFGQVMHCSGSYQHDLREEICGGEENRHYRLRNYLGRNCENYPTHELLPIGKMLDINYGNKFISLSSVASESKGLHEYVLKKRGTDSKLTQANFRQGDVVTTILRCAGGQTVTITLNTTLPYYYSRSLCVHGTKAYYNEWNDTLYIDELHHEYEWDAKPIWGNAEQFEEKYLHRLWRDYTPEGGHGGMDWLVYSAFVDCVKRGIEPPIDVYDTATYMAVSVLSEQSIAVGGAPVAFPDFTEGKYLDRAPWPQTEYSLYV
jgi:glycosyl hydrolase family 109 protein